MCVCVCLYTHRRLKSCDPVFAPEASLHFSCIPHNPPSSAPLCTTLSSLSPSHANSLWRGQSTLLIPPLHTHTLPWLTGQSAHWSQCRSLHQTTARPSALDLPPRSRLLWSLSACVYVLFVRVKCCSKLPQIYLCHIQKIWSLYYEQRNRRRDVAPSDAHMIQGNSPVCWTIGTNSFDNWELVIPCSWANFHNPSVFVKISHILQTVFCFSVSMKTFWLMLFISSHVHDGSNIVVPSLTPLVGWLHAANHMPDKTSPSISVFLSHHDVGCHPQAVAGFPVSPLVSMEKQGLDTYHSVLAHKGCQL